MSPEPVVVAPGQGHRVGNVEFLARTADTPRFTFGIIEIAPADARTSTRRRGSTGAWGSNS